MPIFTYRIITNELDQFVIETPVLNQIYEKNQSSKKKMDKFSEVLANDYNYTLSDTEIALFLTYLFL